MRSKLVGLTVALGLVVTGSGFKAPMSWADTVRACALKPEGCILPQSYAGTAHYNLQTTPPEIITLLQDNAVLVALDGCRSTICWYPCYSAGCKDPFTDRVENCSIESYDEVSDGFGWDRIFIAVAAGNCYCDEDFDNPPMSVGPPVALDPTPPPVLTPIVFAPPPIARKPAPKPKLPPHIPGPTVNTKTPSRDPKRIGG